MVGQTSAFSDPGAALSVRSDRICVGRWEDRGQGGSGVCGRPEGQVQGLVHSAVSTGPQGFMDPGVVECEGGP